MNGRIRVPVIPRRPTFREKYAALVRQREAANDPEHVDHGAELNDLVLDEMTRQPAPNRALRRAAGARSGFARRQFQVGQMALEMARLDAIEANPQRLAQHQARQQVRRERAARVATRVAARLERLGITR